MATGFHYVKDVCHKARAFVKRRCFPEYPPSVSLSPALPGAFASEGILPHGGFWLVTYSFIDENHNGVTPFRRLIGW